MFKRKSKSNAFTLIELIGVLVIMAILALIATPLVMSIIRKARVSADKRSVDAYGRSIELAIAGYLLDTGKFATDISQLTIEYSGDEVVCETTQINTDSSVYLAGCKVKGRDVTNYTYGSDKSPTYKAYSIGDQVNYNNVDYYVIKDSSSKESTVTLLKAEPLTVEEVNKYGGVGTENNHINMYSAVGTDYTWYRTAYDENGYGGMAYYSSETCGYVNNSWVKSGCTTEYNDSEIKYVVDAWKTEQSPAAREARLITINELINDFDYQYYDDEERYKTSSNTPSWIYSSNYTYWTMTPASEIFSNPEEIFSDPGYKNYVEYVDYDGKTRELNCYGNCGGYCIPSKVVRPVIVLDKSVLPTE